MSYILASHMPLQILLYNTMINATVVQMIDNKRDTYNDGFVELKSKLKENTDQYKHCESLYNEILTKFIDRYQIETGNVGDHGYQKGYKIEIPVQDDATTFEIFIQDTIQEYSKKNKISENEQKFFNFHANLFFNGAEFIFRTISEIHFKKFRYDGDMHKLIRELYKDSKYLKKLILTCNWIQKIIGNTEYCILYTFEKFVVSYENNKYIIVFNIKYEPEVTDFTSEEIITTMKEYIENLELNTIQDIVKFINFEEVKKIIVGKKSKIEDEKIQTIFTNVTSEMSLQTKITYLSKKNTTILMKKQKNMN